MAALTIRHDGLVASGHLIRGTGRKGSVGVHVVAGLDLVVIDGFTIRDFDVCLIAESPVVIVNCDILRWQSAGVILRGASSWVAFCSFLDESTSGKQGAAIIAQSHSPVVQANLFQISGEKRYFGIGDPRRAAWNSKDNIGVAAEAFGVATGIADAETVASASIVKSALSGITEDSPGFAVTTQGAEHLRLLSSSPALRLVVAADLPEISSRRFDSSTHLPVVDRDENRRAVQYLTAGAHEMSFSLTHAGRVRMLELIGGLSSKPFNRVASGRDGVFHRMPGVLGNNGVDPTENPLDIQHSPDLSVLSTREHLVGDASAYFKAERLGRLAHTLSAAPSRRSDLRGATAVSVYGWVKALSPSADIIVHRSGDGRAQDRPVLEVATLFGGVVAPNISIKMGRDGAPGQDVTFVAESALLRSKIQQWTRDQRWFFLGWSWSGSLPTLVAGSEDDDGLRAYSSRAFVLNPRTEEMTPSATIASHPLIDPNSERIFVGSDQDGARAWHGYIDELSIDIGEARTRDDLEAAFSARAQLPDVNRTTRFRSQLDLVVARGRDIYIKPPQAFIGEIGSASGVFAEIRTVAASGPTVYVAARRDGQATWGVYSLDSSPFSTMIEAIPDLLDIAIDMRGHLVLLATDMRLSRIDPEEGVRYQIDVPAAAYSRIAVTKDNEYILCTQDGTVTLVDPRFDLTNSAPESTQDLEISVGLTDVRDVAVSGANEVFILDGTRVVVVSFSRVLDLSQPLGVDVPLPASASFTDPSVDFGAAGVLPGDAFSIVSVDDDLAEANGSSVSDDADPLVADNAGVRYVVSVSGHTVVLDRPFVAEDPPAGHQFEARIVRRASSDAICTASSALVDPVAIAAIPDEMSAVILVADKGARRDPGDPATGVVFSLAGGELTVVHHLSTLGVDLGTIRSIAYRENPTLPATAVVSKLRSRLTWHMEFDASNISRIPNAAAPGMSDLDVPAISLNEHLVTKRAGVSLGGDNDEATATYVARFGSDPAMDRAWLNTEYENLSEMGIVTEDGVLLARLAVARMPYDPLCEVRTDWSQTITVG